ncbi:hypothetical protein ACI65C_002346 [Semiaphis heraclei]
MSEMNALAAKKPKKKKTYHKSLNTNEAEIKLFDKTCVEFKEQNINGSDLTENVKNLSNKKNFIESLNLIELNITKDVEMKLLENTYEEVNEQNIIRSYSRMNVNRKRKSEKDDLAGISLDDDNCRIDTENFPTKKRKKKNHNGSLNSIEFSTNDTENQIFEKTYEDVIDSDFRDNVNKSIKPELYTSFNISLENSMNNDNVAIKKPKKKKKHDISLNCLQLNTNNDVDYQNNEHIINDSDAIGNKSRTIMSEINGSPTKKSKKKKNHDKSLKSLELETNHDNEIQIFEKTHEDVNDQNIISLDNREIVNQRIQPELSTPADILLENKCSVDSDDVAAKKSNKYKKHNTSLNSIERNANNDVNYRINEKDNGQNINISDSADNISQKILSEINALPTKKPKKKKKHDKSLKSIELETNCDNEIQIFEKQCEDVNDRNINSPDYRENVNQRIQPELSTPADILLENKCSVDSDDVATKKSYKKKKHNTSLNSIEINANNDVNYRINEKDNGQNINISDSADNISQTIMSEINALPTKKPKKKKKHDKSLKSIELETNHDNEIQIFEKTHEDINDPNINSPDYKENVNQSIKPELYTSFNISLENKCSMDNDNVEIKKPKKKKKHDISLNCLQLNTNNDADYQNNEHVINDSDAIENKSQTIMSERNGSPTKKPKKKKNHDKSLKSIELETNRDNEIQIFEKQCEDVNDRNINSPDYREIVNQRTQPELSTPADILLENKCSVDRDDVATKKSNKKKKNNASLNSIETNTNNDVNYRINEKDNEHIINDFDAIENKSQTIMSEINGSPTKKSKKKKNHDKSLKSIELETNHDNEIQIFEKTHEDVNDQNIISLDNREIVNQRIQPELSTPADILLENKCNVDSDDVANKKKKHNTSLNSIEINANNYVNYRINEKDNGQTINISDSADNISQKILSEKNALADISLGNDSSFYIQNLATKVSKKRKKHNILKAGISNCTSENTIPMISQDHCRLKNLLNSMDLHNSEESSSTIKTDCDIKHFNLLKYLTKKDPSLKNHPKFKQINEHLSKKIKQSINLECKIGASDIVLLKTVGKIILKKIVEKIDSAQDIKDLVIKLPSECQENTIHFMETTLSRLPNKNKMDIIKKKNPLIKLRIFNKDEDNMIREYWSKFQKEYNITNILPFLSNGLEMALSPTERLQFIRYISAGLPNRLLYSVYNRFNILFNEYQDKTYFSEEEDQLIMKVDKCDAIKNKFSVLSLILNRTRLQLYRRLEVLKNQHNKCKIVIWDDQKRQELFTNILLETNTEHWKDLKNMTITRDVWIKIAKNLGENFTYKKVRYQWNILYTMLFCEKPILMSTFNVTVITLLEKKNPKYWSDLNWIEITNLLYPGANSKVICSFFHSWIDKKVPSNIKENIRDTLVYLREHEVEKLKNRICINGEREFPRLTVKHYDLLVNNQ